MLIQLKSLENYFINNPACDYLHDRIRRRLNHSEEFKYKENIHAELSSLQVKLGVASDKL